MLQYALKNTENVERLTTNASNDMRLSLQPIIIGS